MSGTGKAVEDAVNEKWDFIALIPILIFFMGLIFCGDAERWQQLVAASLTTLVWLEWRRFSK